MEEEDEGAGDGEEGDRAEAPENAVGGQYNPEPHHLAIMDADNNDRNVGVGRLRNFGQEAAQPGEPVQRDVINVEEEPEVNVAGPPPPRAVPLERAPEAEDAAPGGLGFVIGGGLGAAHQALLLRDGPTGFHPYTRPACFPLKVSL